MTPFIKPDYSRNNFSLLPALTQSLLTGGPRPAIDLSLARQRYDRVILMLVDAFGWRFLDEARRRHAVLAAGQAIKLTAQFPSTTSAHVTTWHTGLPVGEHGQFEWQYYDPAADDIVTPLLFSYGGTIVRDQIWPHGLRPQDLYLRHSLYQGLRQQGIHPLVLQPAAYTPGTYTDFMYRGAAVQPYKTLAHALTFIRSWLETSPTPAYLAFYFAQIDSICHHYGPDAPETWAEIDLFFQALDALLLRPRRGGTSPGRTLLLLTADHGQAAVSPEATCYLNTRPEFRDLLPLLRRNRRGEILAPGGSPRDQFLYVRPGQVDQAAAILQAGLDGWGEVRRVDEMIAEGYFGPRVSDRFRQRVGDLVVLAYPGKCVWWHEPGRYEQKFYGHHGGLTPEEMEIPLIAWEI